MGSYVLASNAEQGEPAPGEYRPPAIVWEQPFVALAQISPPPCDPETDPNCEP